MLSLVTSSIAEDNTIKDLLEKCRRLVGHFNSSNLAKDRLREEQEREGAPVMQLIQVWFDMFSIFIQIFCLNFGI